MDENKRVQNVQSKVTFYNPEGLSLVGIIHTPLKAKDLGVILCHGFTGSKDRNFISSLAEGLEVVNYPVLRFDFSGNGESEGRFEDRTYTKYVDDLRTAIAYFKQYVSHICVTGHSMGGAIAILEYEKYRNYDACVLLAPGIVLTRNFFTTKQKDQLQTQGYLEFIAWGEKKRLTREYFEDRKRYNILESGGKVAIPTLLLIGEKDIVVSVDACKKLAYANKKVTLKVLTEEDHLFHNKTDAISEHINPFLISASPQ